MRPPFQYQCPMSFCRITLDEGTHNTTSCLNAKGKRGNIEAEKVLSLLRGITGKDGSLDCGGIGDSLVRVDALVRLFAVEEVGNKLCCTCQSWSRGGRRSRQGQVPRNRSWQSSSKQARVRSIEVDTPEKRVDLNGSLSSGRKGTLGMLASSAKTTKGTRT
jgi:NAD-specific glutamate dehydrogenase